MLLERRCSEHTNIYWLLLENMTPKQWLKFKNPIINANNHLNRIFPSFNSLNYEFSPKTQLIDIFSSYFLFHHANHKYKESKATYFHKLDKNVFCTSNNSKSVVVVLDISIKNNVVISILYVYSLLNPIKKTIYYAVNITSTKTELFGIRYSINYVIQTSDINYIIIVIDAIHITLCIFNSSVYPYQHQSIAILKELREFFNKNPSNSIELYLYSHASHLRILKERVNTIIS